MNEPLESRITIIPDLSIADTSDKTDINPTQPTKRRRKSAPDENTGNSEKRPHSLASSENEVEDEDLSNLKHKNSKSYLIGDRYRGPYKCSKCGQTKKGHVCPYGLRDVKDVEVQVELDENMTVIKMKQDEYKYIAKLQGNI